METQPAIININDMSFEELEKLMARLDYEIRSLKTPEVRALEAMYKALEGAMR